MPADVGTEGNPLMDTGREMMELAIVLDQMSVNPKYYHEGEKSPRITRAHQWVKDGKVHDVGGKTYTVDGSKPGTSYTVSQGHCDCDNAKKGVSALCYHAIAVHMYEEWQRRITPMGLPFSLSDRMPVPDDTPPPSDELPVVDGSPVAPILLDGEKLSALRHQIVLAMATLGLKCQTKADYESAVMEHTGVLLAPENFPLIVSRLEEIVAAHVSAPPPPKPPTIGREYLVTIKGKDYVLFAGLLALAHAQGLQSLTARFVSVTPELALAEASATFADGRSFSEAGDATPSNVNKGVIAHFARVALTRAKARCLRDSLNISEIAFEELAEG